MESEEDMLGDNETKRKVAHGPMTPLRGNSQGLGCTVPL